MYKRQNDLDIKRCFAFKKIIALIPLTVITLLMACQPQELPYEAIEDQPRTAIGDTVWVIENFIIDDKRQQFEQFLGEFWMLLEKVGEEDEAIRQAVRKTRVLSPAESNEDGSWSYFFMMDPVVSGVNYDILSLLEQALPEDEAEELYIRFTETQERPQSQWRTTQSRAGIGRAAPDDSVWVIRYPVYEEKKEQFEQFVNDFWSTGIQFTENNPDFPDAFEKTRVLFPTQPDDDGTWSYFIVADPFIPGVDYSLLNLLEKMHPEEEAARQFSRFQESVAGSYDDWKLRQIDMDRTIAQLRIYSLWNKGVENLYNRSLSTSQEHYRSAAEIAHNAGLNLEESFSHQYFAMAAGIIGNENLVEEYLEYSLTASIGDDELEEFHYMTGAVAYAGLGDEKKAREYINRFDVDNPLTNPYAANVTNGIVIAATGNIEEARDIVENLIEAPAYQNMVKTFMLPAMMEAGLTDESEAIRNELLAADMFSFWDAVSKWKLDEIYEIEN